MNLVQVQEHLKGMPTQVLMGYANGQNPQVPPYIALGELNRRKQMEQQPAQAPQGSVKDQIEQSLMQPQQLPGLAAEGVPVPQAPQPQGIPSQMPQQLAGAAPQQAPTKMAAGGLASVPVRQDMFSYAPGGIIAFDEGGDVNELPLPEELRIEGMERGTRYRDEMEKAKGKKSEDKADKADKEDSTDSGIAKALAFAGSPLAALADVIASPVNAVRNVVRNPMDRSERPSMTPVSDARQRMLSSDTQAAPDQPRMQGTQASYTRQQMDASQDPRVQAMMAALAQRNEQGGGVASLPGAASSGAPSVGGQPSAGGRPSAGGQPSMGGGAGRVGGGGAGNSNDPLDFLRAQMNAPEPTYKSRADYIAEAAKTNPELLAKPEEGLRGLLEKLGQSQVDARERAMRGERGQQMSDISNALIAAGEATRGQKGSGIGSAFGGFGKTFNASSAAATERQAQRDALQQKQDLDMAKLQYEISEKARARAMGDVNKEMEHDKNIAELQNKVRDDKRQAANYLAVDARTREANASAHALRREQMQAIKDAKPSPESKLLTDVMARVNGDDRIAAISNSIKSGNLLPGTPEFNKAIRATEALAAPYYAQAGLKPPSAAQLAEDAAEPSKKGFWASLFGSDSTPAAPAATTIPEGWSVKKNP